MTKEITTPDTTALAELIVCAGHASFGTEYQPADIEQDPFDTILGKWILQSFQQGEPPYYGEHTKRGLELLADSPKALLIFSGGFTRPESVGGKYDWSEAATYHTAAERSGWLATRSLTTLDFDTDAGKVAIPVGEVELDGKIRTVAHNEYARDSIENVMGDIVSYNLLTGKWPTKISVVGWQFKEQRFTEHAQALGIPEAIFNYVGVNDPADIFGAEKGEIKAIKQFEEDPLGVDFIGKEEEFPGSLAGKRATRDPLNRGNPHWDLYKSSVLEAPVSPW